MYIDITASDKIFRLCVALPKCSVAPAGNKFSNNFSCFISCMIFHVYSSTAHCIYVSVYWADTNASLRIIKLFLFCR